VHSTKALPLSCLSLSPNPPHFSLRPAHPVCERGHEITSLPRACQLTPHTYKMQGEIDEPYSVLSVSHKLSGSDPVLVECLMKEIEADPTNVRVRLLLCYQAHAFMTSCTHGACSTCTSSLFARLAQSIAWIASSCPPLPALFFPWIPNPGFLCHDHDNAPTVGQPRPNLTNVLLSASRRCAHWPMS
jgi:hypothetical protein